VFKQNAAILCAMLFSCTQLNAMFLFPENADENFQEYLRTGDSPDDNPMDMQLITKRFNTLEAKLPVALLDTNISTPEFAALLEDLPSSEIAERYALYRTVYNTFLSTLFLQQAIARRMLEPKTPEESTTLQSFTQQLRERQTKTSAWLTAIRKSGEEHYVGVSHLNIKGVSVSKKEFWESQLKPRVLANLKTLYENKIYLNLGYMTMFRNQLDSNLE